MLHRKRIHPGAEGGHRELVYAFYNPDFSFKKVIDKYPEAAGEITDCLSGDVNKDFSPLWKKFHEFVPLPEDMAVGLPFDAKLQFAQT